MQTQRCSRWSIIALVGILCLQTIIGVYFGNRKAGFHEDEMATFTLSNHADGFLSKTKSLMNNWVDGSVLYDILSVSEEKAFDYQMVYRNQQRDVHPPLYYYLIHTISSLFQGQFSKWIGIIPNIIFCLFTSILLFFISRRLMQCDFLAIITVAGWGFSIGAIDITTFLRMYAMLTFWTVLFVYLHIKAFDQTISGQQIGSKLLVLLFLCTFSGLLTQYYFSVFALFLCGFFFFYLLFSQRWKDIGLYVLVEFGAIGASVGYYPEMIRHILGNGYRGKEAFRNLQASGNFIDQAKSVIEIISKDTCNGWIKELMLLCIALVIVASLKYFFRLSVAYTDGTLEFQISRVPSSPQKGTLRISVNTLVIGFIGLVLLCYIILIAKVAPYLQDRYYMCLYPLITLCVVYTVFTALAGVFTKSSVTQSLTLLIILFITTCGLIFQKPGYLYPDAVTRANILKDYNEKPVIVFNGTYDWYPTHWLVEYNDFSEVYLCEYNSDLSRLKAASEANNLSDGFVLYALRCSEHDEELLAKIKENLPVKEFKKLCGGQDRVFFCTLEG